MDDAAKSRITKHMNDDHADSVLAYVKHYAALPDASSARIVDLDLHGMLIAYTTSTDSTEQTVRVEFLAPLESPRDARSMMVKMANEASQALGIEIKRD